METFKFYIDQKITTWERTHFNIEANSKKEAVEKARAEEQAKAKAEYEKLKRESEGRIEIMEGKIKKAENETAE